MKSGVMNACVAALTAALGLAVPAQTVTNTYALVAGWGDANVNLYKVGDDGAKWSFVRTVRSAKDGTTKHVSDAVCVGDVVYVLDMRDETTTSERFIRKYALDGRGYLGDLASLGTDREAGCMCLSSDGQSLYVGYTFRTAAGRVDKVSLADGTVTQDFATGLGAIRQLATDGKGHLYTGDRAGSLKVVRETDGQVLATVAGNVNCSQGVAYDPVNDCCWWSRRSTANYGTFSFAEPDTVTMGLSLTDGAWGSDCFAVATLDGLPYFGSFSDKDKKIYRRAADGTIAAVTDAEGNVVTYPALICGLTFFREEIEIKDVARVYVTLPSVGVKTYVVDSRNTWRLEGTFAANAAGKMDHPVAFHKAGDFFYACDQHEDRQLGYFSISRYDAWGAYRGRLVDKCTRTAPKADNMTVSPDGKYLYVSCFNGGSLLRVSTADGTVESFATADISNSRGACVSSDGTIFVANRGAWKATAYDPTTGEVKGSYSKMNASGVFCDDETGLVYVSDNGSGVTVYNRDGSSAGVTLTGTGNCMAIAKVNGQIVFGNWDGAIMAYEPGSGVTTPMTVLSGLGNIQHLYVEPIVEGRVRPDERTISFSAPETGDWFVVRDEGLGVVNAAEKTTIWKSSDKGRTWSEQTSLAGVLRPSVYTCSDQTILFGEKVRASAEDPLVVMGYKMGTDGTWSQYFEPFGVGASRAPNTAARLSGGVVAMPRMYGGVRPFVPTMSGKMRKFGAFSLLDPSWNNPDPCFATENVELADYFNAANSSWRDEKNPLDALAAGTAVAMPSGGVALLLPNVQRRSVTADRLSEESVLVSTNWYASHVSAIVGWAKLPGGGKPLTAFWDEPSACYWAVTVPETNLTQVLVSEPGETRNVLALYASENLFDWRAAGVIRAEGTPETVVFDRPCAAVDGDDLVLVYKAAGASSTTDVTALTTDGSLVFQRVADFRRRKPSFAKADEILLSANYSLKQIDRYVKDPVTGAWQSDGVFAVGNQLGRQFVNLVGIASTRGRVYVTCETVGIFEFSLDGRCRRFIDRPSGHNVDAIVVSPDGRTAWVTDCNKGSSAVMKLDLQTGAWTILTTIENGMPRALAVAKDGSFYVGCRENLATGNIRHYAADGRSYEVLDLGFRDVVSLALNAAEDVLYCGSRYGRVVKVELANDNRQTELTASGAQLDNGTFSILPKGDTLYCVDGTAAIQYTLDANTANQLPVPLVGGGLFLGRSAFVDTAFKYGMTIIIR